MTSEHHWRQKYEALIAEQDAQQAAFEQQQTQLRRAMVRVSLAVEGFDEQLDVCLSRLREAFKGEVGGHRDGADGLEATPGALDAAIAQLEASVLQFETKREQEWQSCQTALQALVQHGQAMAGEQAAWRAMSKRIRQAGAQESSAVLRQMAELLQANEFAQEADLSDPGTGSVDQPEPRGWLDRFRRRPAGGIESQPEVDAGPIVAERPSEASVEARPVLEEEVLEVEVLEGEVLTHAEAEAEDQREAIFQRPVHEPAFSRVSDKVHSILTDLLERVEPVGCTEQKALAARQRLARGLNWYELVPTLEDIRDLVLQAYLMADEEYRSYLRRLDEELAEILSVLDLTSDAHQHWMAADDDFQHSLSQQLGALGRSVSVATEVHSLQQDIHSHLAQIQTALQHSQAQKAKSQATMETELCRLTQRLQSLEQQASEAARSLTEARQQALTDGLTGLPNREAYNERAYLEWHRWQRYGEPLTLVVCDIDHFKSINDRFGHQAGDRVLQVLSKALSQRLRAVDFIARYGGEEFVLLLPNTSLSDGTTLMEKMRTVIASTPLRFKQEPLSVTLSMGVVAVSGEETIEQAFARADQLLYRAKALGRNRCVHD